MGNIDLSSIPFYDLEKTGARIKEILNKAESSNDAMVFKGVIITPSDVWDNIVPANKWSAGWTWKIGYKMNSSDDLYGFAPSGSTEFEIGDLLIATKDHPEIAVGYSNIESLNDYFVLISANTDGSVTSAEFESEDGEIPVFSGANGRVIKKSGTNIERIFGDKEVVIGLNESVPENAIPSICDFKINPTTQPVYYCPSDKKFWTTTDNNLSDSEIPLATTKGFIVVKDKGGVEKYRKEIPEVISVSGISDEIHPTQIIKKWSAKKYITADPSINESITGGSSSKINRLFTFEFSEEDFCDTGLPLKLDDIPFCSTAIYRYNRTSIENTSGGHLWGGEVPRGVFYWDEETSKYYLKIRTSNYNGNPFKYTKFYFYYQIETHVIDDEFYLAMGLSSDDVVEFEYDASEFDIFIENNLLYNSNKNSDANLVTSIDLAPALEISVPTSILGTMQGFPTTAKILNRGVVGRTSISSGGGDYSWIGDGDGTTDYTTIIQNKIDEIYSIDGKGTVYLGKGTYPINGSLILYDDVSLIGVSIRETVIEQHADNTHAIVLSGSYITVGNLSIRLVGECTELTGCVYINSDNRSGDNFNSLYPENIYVQHANIENVYLSGNYKFDKDDEGNRYVGDTYNTYKGCGILGFGMYFNYANINNCNCYYLYSGLYTSAGSCVINIDATFCHYAVLDGGGYNTYNIIGHSYYTNDKDGNTISMSDAVVYVTDGHCNNFNIMTYDQQWYKKLIHFSGMSADNKYLIVFGGQTCFSNNVTGIDDRSIDIYVEDFGRGNRAIAPFKDTPYHIGSRFFDISGQTSLKPFDMVVNNALAGAGIWGSITSNIEWDETNLSLKDVCRYPKENYAKNVLASIVSTVSPSVDSPIEIKIDCSNRTIQGFNNIVIQFDHRHVAEDFVVYINENQDGTYDKVIGVTGNVDSVYYYMCHQNNSNISDFKIVITKALQIDGFTYQDSAYRDYTIDYNPNGLIGIVNIGAVADDYCGRSFLGECGGTLYGDLNMADGTYLKLGMTTELPEASEEYRGRQIILKADAGDKIYTCLYNGNDYEWKTNN